MAGPSFGGSRTADATWLGSLAFQAMENSMDPAHLYLTDTEDSWRRNAGRSTAAATEQAR